MVDDIDRSLLVALMADARLTYQQLAVRVHLSPNSTADRVRRLKTSGVVAGYRAELDLSVLGRQLRALTDIKLSEATDRHDFERDLAEIPAVLSATHTTGEYDYQLRLAIRDTAELEDVVDALRRFGARDIQSRIVLGEVSYDLARLL